MASKTPLKIAPAQCNRPLSGEHRQISVILPSDKDVCCLFLLQIRHLVALGSGPDPRPNAIETLVISRSQLGEKDGADIWRAGVGGNFVSEYFFIVQRKDQQRTAFSARCNFAQRCSGATLCGAHYC